MRNQPAAADQGALLDEVRSMMAPINPVAPSAFEAEEQDWVKPAQPGRSFGRWRVLAPVLSGLSLIAVALGVTLAGGAHRPTAAGGPGALPKFYVTVNGFIPHETAIVHSTATGKTLTSVHIPEADGYTFSMIAASRSDREFYLSASVRRHKFGRLATGILRLNISADGRSAKLTRLPVYIDDPASPDKLAPEVADMTVSPDGRELAVVLNPTRGDDLPPLTSLIIIPTHSGGHPAIWRTPEHHLAYVLDVNWVSNNSVAFLLQDHFTNNPNDDTFSSAVRLLNLRTSSGNLLDSTVLLKGGGSLGVIQSAYAPHGNGPIIAALVRDTPVIGPKGVVLERIVAASPVTGKITKVFVSRVQHYHTAIRRFSDNLGYEILAVDASGRDALVAAPKFGMISHGIFTALPTGRGRLYNAAAW